MSSFESQLLRTLDSYTLVLALLLSTFLSLVHYSDHYDRQGKMHNLTIDISLNIASSNSAHTDDASTPMGQLHTGPDLPDKSIILIVNINLLLSINSASTDDAVLHQYIRCIQVQIYPISQLFLYHT